MGASESSEAAPELSDLDPEVQRSLMRNFEMLACRDQNSPNRFTASDWRAVCASAGMATRLTEGLWLALSRGAASSAADADSAGIALKQDAVVRAVAPLLVGGAVLARWQQQHLEAAFPGSQATAVEVAFDEAAPWLYRARRRCAHIGARDDPLRGVPLVAETFATTRDVLCALNADREAPAGRSARALLS